MVGYSTIKQNAYDAKVDAALNQAEKLVTVFDTKNSLKPHPSYSMFTVRDQMKTQGLVDDAFLNQLKASSPARSHGASGHDDEVRIFWCGARRYLIIAEAYSGGISEPELNTKLQQCYADNANWNGAGGGFGTGTSSYTRHFRIKELKFE